jgi:hypothetical protein
MQLEWGTKKYIMDFGGANPLNKVNLEDQGGGGKITLIHISTKYTGYEGKILKLADSLIILLFSWNITNLNQISGGQAILLVQILSKRCQ